MAWPNGSESTDDKYMRILKLCIADLLYREGNMTARAALLEKAGIPESEAYAPGIHLEDWWIVFCTLFEANRSGTGSNDELTYLECVSKGKEANSKQGPEVGQSSQSVSTPERHEDNHDSYAASTAYNTLPQYTGQQLTQPPFNNPMLDSRVVYSPTSAQPGSDVPQNHAPQFVEPTVLMPSWPMQDTATSSDVQSSRSGSRQPHTQVTWDLVGLSVQDNIIDSRATLTDTRITQSPVQEFSGVNTLSGITSPGPFGSASTTCNQAIGGSARHHSFPDSAAPSHNRPKRQRDATASSGREFFSRRRSTPYDGRPLRPSYQNLDNSAESAMPSPSRAVPGYQPSHSGSRQIHSTSCPEPLTDQMSTTTSRGGATSPEMTTYQDLGGYVGNVASAGPTHVASSKVQSSGPVNFPFNATHGAPLAQGQTTYAPPMQVNTSHNQDTVDPALLNGHPLPVVASVHGALATGLISPDSDSSGLSSPRPETMNVTPNDSMGSAYESGTYEYDGFFNYDSYFQ